jgi:hypothetical protein
VIVVDAEYYVPKAQGWIMRAFHQLAMRLFIGCEADSGVASFLSFEAKCGLPSFAICAVTGNPSAGLAMVDYPSLTLCDFA